MPDSKVCFKCGVLKQLTEYYKHPQMGDGHLNKCKECTKRDVLIHRGENIEKIRQYDRTRAALPHRVAQNIRVNREWRAEDRRRSAAYNAVARALKSGALVPKDCERCGCENSVAHHESYAKENQLKVIWLCQPCHKERHKEMVLEGIEP